MEVTHSNPATLVVVIYLCLRPVARDYRADEVIEKSSGNGGRS
jgi:hypothetical protein